MSHISDPGLTPEQEQLIMSLLKHGSRSEAAEKAGVNRRTMYRWFEQPAFRAAYRRARRSAFDEALAVIEETSIKAARALAAELGPERTGEFSVIAAATRVLQSGFKAMETVEVDEELESLREMIEELRKVAKGPPERKKDTSRYRMSETEQAAAILARMTWMRELGHSTEDIEDSIRFNRPQSLTEENYLVELVRKLLEVERMYDTGPDHDSP